MQFGKYTRCYVSKGKVEFILVLLPIKTSDWEKFLQK